MSQTKHLLELAKRAATKAINAERDREYKVAFDQFLRAAEVEVLNQLIAIQKNQKVRDTYYVKASEYIKRAKEIKLLMNGPSTKIESKDLPAPPKSTPKPPAPPPKKDQNQHQNLLHRHQRKIYHLLHQQRKRHHHLRPLLQKIKQQK
ncbi:MAG: hypothetical protein ACTSSK_17795 [Candidatus Heimdallarchaeota archaeon]